MKSVVTVVGARPQFVKAAVVSRAFQQIGLVERIVHTGQHYDENLSAIFFEEMGIPEPDVNLNVGSGSHAVQTGELMVRLESDISEKEKPDAVIVFGDTNTTLAAAVVARKLLIPVAHIEAGLRSFNMSMPEEINRVITDRLSDFLFCPTQTAVENLLEEGLEQGVYLSGDVMYDAVTTFSKLDTTHKSPMPEGDYVLATVHRQENVEDPERLSEIISGLGKLDVPVLFPAHPRTKARLTGFALPSNVQVIDPLSYVQMLKAVKGAIKIITDSGGLQKESLWLETPCVTVRDETEWPETLTNSWNILTGADSERIVAAVDVDPSGPPQLSGVVGTGSASHQIAHCIASA